MKTDKLIKVSELCTHYHLDRSFFEQIEYYEMIEIRSVEDDKFIHRKQLRKLEKIIRLHNELEINLQGIDVIFEMMSKIKKLEDELREVHNRLELYE